MEVWFVVDLSHGQKKQLRVFICVYHPVLNLQSLQAVTSEVKRIKSPLQVTLTPLIIYLTSFLW